MSLSLSLSLSLLLRFSVFLCRIFLLPAPFQKKKRKISSSPFTHQNRCVSAKKKIARALLAYRTRKGERERVSRNSAHLSLSLSLFSSLSLLLSFESFFREIYKERVESVKGSIKFFFLVERDRSHTQEKDFRLG